MDNQIGPKLLGFLKWCSDKFWEFLDVLFLGAALSAFIWSLVWLFGFVILIGMSMWFKLPTETSALAITFAVLLGHLPKFVATFLGTDTDFQDFRQQIGQFSLRDVPWLRIFLSIGVIFYLMNNVIPSHIGHLTQPLEPTDTPAFVGATLKGVAVCFALFLVQAIFSWPKQITKPTDGRAL